MTKESQREVEKMGAAICKNVDRYCDGKISREAFDANQRRLWNMADALRIGGEVAQTICPMKGGN